MRVDTDRVIDLTALEDRVEEQWRPPRGHPINGLYGRFGKRLLDLTLGLVLAVLTLPIQVATAILAAVLWLDQPPVLRLQRIGKADRHFRMLRIATAPRHERGSWSWPRIGGWLRRSGLDELTQLWNVVVGQMSLVGPRPLRPGSDPVQSKQERRQVRPGLTGMRQLEIRANGHFPEGTTYADVQYIDQISVATDVRILARTLPAVGWRTSRPATWSKVWSRRETLHTRLMLTDLFLWVAGVTLATWAHFDFAWTQVHLLGMILASCLGAAVQLLWASYYGLYRGRWRLTSPEELASVSVGATVVTATLVGVGTFAATIPPTGALLSAGVFYLAGALSSRLFADFTYTRKGWSKHNRTERLLVFGAGEAGMSAVKAIWNDQNSSFLPVAFLDDDASKHRNTIRGLPVLGDRMMLAEAAGRYDADTLLIAMPSAHPREVEAVANLARTAGLEVQILPPLSNWLSALLVERARASSPDEEPPAGRQRAAKHITAWNARERGTFDLAVVGLGYVGLPVALEASRAGLRVCGLDIDVERVMALNSGRTYVSGIGEQDLKKARDGGFLATTDPSVLTLAGAITISVPTPLKEGLPDLSAVISASEAVGRYLRPGHLVILESTTYPGTTEEVVRPILEDRSGLTAGEGFFLAYSPERIDPGNAEFGIHNTPKLIAGVDQASTEQAAMLYRKFSPVVEMTGTREAEMAKLLENTYRHVNIALINEMAVFCHDLGVDIWETIRGAATKPFGFEAFYPGPGVGGHCIPIDPNYLSYRVQQLGKQFRFIELAQEINDFMPSYAVDRAVDLLEQLEVDPSSSRILIIGVAYKPDINDTRETPASDIVRLLRERGASVHFFDPHVETFSVDTLAVPHVPDPVAAAAEADLTIIHTPHKELDLPSITGAAKFVFDLRGTLGESATERL